ncbi:MAG: hypothetical protein ACOH5I_10090 [Oligoflexus sp.]
MNKTADCPRCGIEGKLQKRTFSDQAVAALVVWEELDRSLIDEPICNDCYRELREVLIERSEDLLKVKADDLVRAS